MIFGSRAAILGVSLPMLLASPVPTLTMLLENNSVRCEEAFPTVTPEPAVNLNSVYQGEYVLTLVNSHTTAIATAHNQNVGSPTALHDGGSIIEAGATAVVAFPTGWSGRIAMAEADTPIRDRASLLEGAFAPPGDALALITLDVSYVDGFTVPIVCECQGEVVLGCNLNLLHMCPSEYRLDAGTCMNPLRDGGNIETDNFFRECASLAYTFPSDDEATRYGIQGCEASIQCCVGTACAPHPRQKLCPAADGTAEPCFRAQPQYNSSIS
ncbi:hypothetical protein GGR51DRAFT_563976 [Nemania sp. FL0031]|nr:hypothetical protein GGR51DRAFT_563976 [Nemania sp. FL0031]